jgi:hypothetical protein
MAADARYDMAALMSTTVPVHDVLRVMNTLVIEEGAESHGSDFVWALFADEAALDRACSITLFMDGECLQEHVALSDTMRPTMPPLRYKSAEALLARCSPFMRMPLVKLQVCLSGRDADYMSDIGGYLSRKLPASVDIWL